MKIYQIYYKPEHKEHLDSGFIPYDNTENINPHLAEWPNYYKIWQNYKDTDDEYCGMVSWKFKQKNELSAKQVYDFIEKNPGYDIYLFNSALEHEALFKSVWEQGEYFHSGITDTTTKFFKYAGINSSHDLNSLFITRDKTVFSQYVVANKKFWNSFFNLTNRFFNISDPDLHNSIFTQTVNYLPGSTFPRFPFIVERLYSTIIAGMGFKSIAFKYNENNCPVRYRSSFNHIMELSDLKIQIDKTQDNKLYEEWDNKRRK